MATHGAAEASGVGSVVPLTDGPFPTAEVVPEPADGDEEGKPAPSIPTNTNGWHGAAEWNGERALQPDCSGHEPIHAAVRVGFAPPSAQTGLPPPPADGPAGIESMVAAQMQAAEQVKQAAQVQHLVARQPAQEQPGSQPKDAHSPCMPQPLVLQPIDRPDAPVDYGGLAAQARLPPHGLQPVPMRAPIHPPQHVLMPTERMEVTIHGHTVPATGPPLAHSQPSYAAPVDPNGGCWGGIITGKLGSCTHGFKPGTAHMKNKFCELCRAGFSLPVERVRALLPEDADRFDNTSASGVWKRSIGMSSRYRLINQTLHCRGPKLLVFEGPSPNDHPFAEMPPSWVCPNGMVRLRTAYGTLVPIETSSFRSRKRWRDDPARGGVGGGGGAVHGAMGFLPGANGMMLMPAPGMPPGMMMPAGMAAGMPPGMMAHGAQPMLMGPGGTMVAMGGMPAGAMAGAVPGAMAGAMAGGGAEARATLLKYYVRGTGDRHENYGHLVRYAGVLRETPAYSIDGSGDPSRMQPAERSVDGEWHVDVMCGYRATGAFRLWPAPEQARHAIVNERERRRRHPRRRGRARVGADGPARRHLLDILDMRSLRLLRLRDCHRRGIYQSTSLPVYLGKRCDGRMIPCSMRQTRAKSDKRHQAAWA